MSKILPMILAAGMSSGGGGGSDSKNYIMISDHNSQATALDLNTLTKGVYIIARGKTSTTSANRLYYKLTNNGVLSEGYFDCNDYGISARLTIYEQIGKITPESGTILAISGNKLSSSPSIYPRTTFYKIGLRNALDWNGGEGSEISLVGRQNEQIITGKKTFTVLPETSIEPTTDNQFTNKKYIDDKVKEVEMFKFPNVTIIGDPTVNNGQISGFSDLNYLEFPFLVDFRGRSFEINFNITTGTDIDNQQNILDSNYGLAFAIKNKHLLIAVSTNGTSWATAQEGTFILNPQTTYDIKISWNGISYKVSYSTNGGSSYTDDITFGQNFAPYPKQMFIGVGKLDDNYFTGSINFNKANLKISDEIVWQGMDDVGLATRLATDLSNIDSAGIERIKDIAGGGESSNQVELTIPYSLNQIRTAQGKSKVINDAEIVDKFKEALQKAYNSDGHLEVIANFNYSTTRIPNRLHFVPDNLISGDMSYYSSRFFTSYICLPYTNDLSSMSESGPITISVAIKVEDDNIYLQDNNFRIYYGTDKVLSLNNYTAYTPTSDYNPATKKYVDDAITSAITTTLGGEY